MACLKGRTASETKLRPRGDSSCESLRGPKARSNPAVTPSFVFARSKATKQPYTLGKGETTLQHARNLSNIGKALNHKGKHYSVLFDRQEEAPESLLQEKSQESIRLF